MFHLIWLDGSINWWKLLLMLLMLLRLLPCFSFPAGLEWSLRLWAGPVTFDPTSCIVGWIKGAELPPPPPPPPPPLLLLNNILPIFNFAISFIVSLSGDPHPTATPLPPHCHPLPPPPIRFLLIYNHGVVELTNQCNFFRIRRIWKMNFVEINLIYWKFDSIYRLMRNLMVIWAV